MRTPRGAAVGVLYPRRALKLGKIHRRACLRPIPFPGTGDVLQAPTMISHPLAYVAPTTRHVFPPANDDFTRGKSPLVGAVNGLSDLKLDPIA